MIYDHITLTEGSKVINLTLDSGTVFPGTANVGELFYRTDVSTMFLYDGAKWVDASNIWYDVALSITGTPPANAVLLTLVSVRTFVLPTNYVGSYGRAGTAGDDLTTFTVLKNGTSIGTISFSASSQSGTFSGTGGQINAGDVLTVVSGATVSSVFANIGITLRGTLLSNLV